jgi:xanthine dehydrogenase accessory factor
MNLWLEHLLELKSTNTPVVLVTLLGVRGHAPRDIGAKMLVTAAASFETIGGGNLEAVAIEMARGMLLNNATGLVRQTLRLTHEQSLFGVQCCGGEVEMLFEPVPMTRACVAIFGVGHVGFALARVLSILPIDLWLIDSRAEMLSPERLVPLETSVARVSLHIVPVLDGVVQDLPVGSHLVIMTHDHAEDLFVLKAALARADLGFLGLIGSAVKWQRFSQKLLEAGFSNLQRVTTPIGLPDVIGKSPEAIALAVAAQLINVLEEPKNQISRVVNYV